MPAMMLQVKLATNQRQFPAITASPYKTPSFKVEIFPHPNPSLPKNRKR